MWFFWNPHFKSQDGCQYLGNCLSHVHFSPSWGGLIRLIPHWTAEPPQDAKWVVQHAPFATPCVGAWPRVKFMAAIHWEKCQRILLHFSALQRQISPNLKGQTLSTGHTVQGHDMFLWLSECPNGVLQILATRWVIKCQTTGFQRSDLHLVESNTKKYRGGRLSNFVDCNSLRSTHFIL